MKIKLISKYRFRERGGLLRNYRYCCCCSAVATAGVSSAVIRTPFVCDKNCSCLGCVAVLELIADTTTAATYITYFAAIGEPSSWMACRGTRRVRSLGEACSREQRQHQLIPTAPSAKTATGRGITGGAAVLCLLRSRGKAASPRDLNMLDQGAILGRRGVPCA